MEPREIADRIRRIMSAKDINQTELSRRMRTSQQRVNYYLNYSSFSIKSLNQIALALHVPTEVFLLESALINYLSSQEMAEERLLEHGEESCDTGPCS